MPFVPTEPGKLSKAVERPFVMTEVRAWMLAAVTLLLHLVGSVWWAATLSAENKQAQETLREVRQEVATIKDSLRSLATRQDLEAQTTHFRRILDDQEKRLRALEARR